jgi:hypothetical protein
MDEEAWQSSTDPTAMLKFLRGSPRASHRKVRLFMVACCRRVIHTFGDDEDWGRVEAIEVAERYADGLASDDEREDAFADLTDGAPHNTWECCTNLAVVDFTQTKPDDVDAIEFAIGAAEEARLDAVCDSDSDPADVRKATDQAEAAAQAGLLRCVFGMRPMRPVTVAPPLLKWHDGLIARMATSIYEERALPKGTLDTVRLAVLADALEEAGCADAELLEHLRSPGPHVRGCFAVDTLVGQE